MILLTILTNDRAHLRTALVSRGVLVADAEAPNGVSPAAGVEIAEVPNPIVVTPGDPETEPPTPDVMDSRWCYLVKLAHEADAADDDDTVAPEPDDDYPRFTRSRLARFVKRNGASDTLSDGTKAWSFANGKHWLLDPRDQGKFGVWQ